MVGLLIHNLEITWVGLAFFHKLGREASRRVLPPLIEDRASAR